MNTSKTSVFFSSGRTLARYMLKFCFPDGPDISGVGMPIFGPVVIGTKVLDRIKNHMQKCSIPARRVFHTYGVYYGNVTDCVDCVIPNSTMFIVRGNLRPFAMCLSAQSKKREIIRAQNVGVRACVGVVFAWCLLACLRLSRGWHDANPTTV